MSKQNLNKVPWMFIQYKFVGPMFIFEIERREVGDVPTILLKHQLTPFVAFSISVTSKFQPDTRNRY